MKILVIQQKRIGDVLLTSILCNSLKQAYPDATIDFMCYPNCKDVLLGNPNIDSIILLPNEVRKSYPSLFKFFFEIRAKKYDVLFDVYGKLETNLITLFSGATTKISYYKWYSSLFYNHNLHRLPKEAKTKYGQAIDNRLLLLQPLKLDESAINPYPKLYVAPKDNDDALALFKKHNVDQNKKIVMISLLGSEKIKTYPLEYMAEIVEYVSQNNDAEILFNYFPSQKEDAQKVYDLCSSETQKKIHFDLLAGTLSSFIAIMDLCDVIIGNDGGAINMAKALNKPSFTIFSPHVDKNDWATFEDGKQNISVHLNDFKPELFSELGDKEVKPNTLQLYTEFKPDFFKDQISFFLNEHL
ncbi:glycosyltransferase family 9 protein [Flavobacterium sp. LC2016-01]|uniref:glycosyltransferase family 9 protein n=1 Tax=Flavobacterium sp. LC2016-01 TaxID=2675876 RepID=UPI0012BAE5C6|nr:glycosyltransferase family 9 protein [Flavobacterium sp. LC2016-01]MTH14385.1 lipopolysaccharide heptosyltransferase family protein [Flavobacterium sp. LC2016-01]